MKNIFLLQTGIIALGFSVGCLFPNRSAAQTARWFDINPSSSNLDPDNPNGASGGRVNHLGATSDLSVVYAATEWGGLYQSFNQGLTWVRINTFSPTATWDVKVDPGNNRRIYATSFYDGRVNSRSGISISDDAGATWRNAVRPPVRTNPCTNANRLNEPSAWQISVSPSNPRTVFVGTNCGLARSLDRGASWTFIDPSPGTPTAPNLMEQVYAVAAHGDQIVDVISDFGHFRSTDNGNTWTPVGAGAGPRPGNSGSQSSLAVSPRENYVLFASTPTNIWESDNGGTTWPTSLTLPLRPGGASNIQGRIPFVKTNQLSTSTQFDLWFGDINLFKTTATTPSTLAPGGTPRAPLNSWTNVQSGAHADVGDVLFDTRFQAGACPRCFANDGGVYRNTEINNPGCQTPSWEQPAITPHATWLWGFSGVQLSPGVHGINYGLQDAGGWAADNATEGFSGAVPGWNNYTCCDVSGNESQSNYLLSVEGFFSPGRNFRLFRRDINGTDDEEIPNYPSAGNIGSFKSGKEVVRFGNNAYGVLLSDGFYITNNVTSNPISWTSLNAPTVPVGATSFVGDVKVANVGNTPNFYYFTGSGDPDGTPGLVFRRTAAAGSAWTQLPLPAGIGSISTYDVDPTNGDRLMISGINALNNTFSTWRTENFGTNWTAMGNLDNLMTGGVFVNRSSTAFAIGGFTGAWQPSMFNYNPRDPGTILAGAVDAGVFLSLDNGANWQLMSNPVNPTSAAVHIPRPLFAYFGPGRFSASTVSFDVWVGTRGAGVMKLAVDRISR